MEIAPGINRKEWLDLELDESNDSEWEKAVKIFRERINSRYLEPVGLLIEKEEDQSPFDRRYGFSIMAIDCLLIETLQSFREGCTDSTGETKNLFKRYLSTNTSFSKYFNEEEAEDFYDNYRCGILHQAEVMGPSLIWSVGELKGKTADGTPYINRNRFHEMVKENFREYCQELLDPSNSDLRNNFREKMDYIARKE